MKKILFILVLIGASMLSSCTKDNDDEVFDNSLCLCEKYFDEYYSDYLIPNYQIKSLTIKDYETNKLLLTVTYYNSVDMRAVTSIVKDISDKYKNTSNDFIRQWQSNGEKGFQIVCNHPNKKKKFNRYIKD